MCMCVCNQLRMEGAFSTYVMEVLCNVLYVHQSAQDKLNTASSLICPRTPQRLALCNIYIYVHVQAITRLRVWLNLRDSRPSTVLLHSSAENFDLH